MKAIHFINEVWMDVDRWWYDEKTQAARRHFCNGFARMSDTPLREMKNILTKI